VLCAGSTLPLTKQSLDEAPYKLSAAVAKLAGITFRRLAFSYWIDNLGFITKGKLAAIFIKPSLGVSNWPVIYFINYTPTIFWHHHHRAINPQLEDLSSVTRSNVVSEENRHL
jgi:hypothetical protein